MSPAGILTFFVFSIAAAIVIPTIPNSRRARLALALVIFPVMILTNNTIMQMVERRSAVLGEEQLNVLVDRCQRLLGQGKGQVLTDAFKDYKNDPTMTDGEKIPREYGAAMCALHLNNFIMIEENRATNRDIPPK